ncbi:acetylornithine deacetylase [Dasania sp. GY-MA-18]|uniref:Acetylornithine deacetylase n=1 Tax=Dasania phycosphaerae TaxID=2950436 RepID=A0A9J6RJ89_9GAMM|nr:MULTISPECIES: acetylornithine deacetylase [Dasania]MCR8922103.1 acetylornithine deacetylase [Dasania sp. GY-MA-18]MCZ0864531.1 acetylornithine deacetylase [Dasania phycosphaerae]MCZ0868259.1 acetylornithine deacetylase [Dasania phycosphaerae]
MPKTVPPLMTMLHELVSEISVSSSSASWDHSNRKVIDKLASWLSTLGFNCEILPLPGKPNKANLIATLGSGPGGLVFSGHTDTVPFDESLWHSNPLAISERDNKLYGLGATDMKGFFPIAIEAAKAFLDQPLKEPLIILATADEESTMDGARALVQHGGPKARYAVIGEPTDLKPIRMHKGIMLNAITIQGKAGHSSNPALGNNALEAMNIVMTDLLQFRSQLQQQYQNPLFEVALPTMNLGCIHGGDNPNRICGHSELHFDIRTLPGMNNDEVQQLLQQRLLPIAQRLQIDISLRELAAAVPPFEEAADAELIKTVERLTGHGAQSVAFATEGPLLQQLGMQTVVMGPGSIDQAHQPNEFMPLAQVQPAIDILQQLIRRYCL